MNTKQIGENSEAQVLAALLKNGEVVLLPFGDNQRYDLVVERGGEFERVQVKTGRIKDGRIAFSTASTYDHRGGGRRGYAGQAECFMVYCPDNDKIYKVQVEAVPPSSSATLRLETPKNNQVRRIMWAKDYEYPLV